MPDINESWPLCGCGEPTRANFFGEGKFYSWCMGCAGDKSKVYLGDCDPGFYQFWQVTFGFEQQEVVTEGPKVKRWGSACGDCGQPARINAMGEAKGFCMACAKEHYLLRIGDHDSLESGVGRLSA